MTDKTSHFRQLKIDASLYTLIFLNSLGFGLIIPVLPDLILEISGTALSKSSLYAGQLLFVYATCQFLLRPIFGVMSDRIGRKPILVFSLIGLTADYVLMAIANDMTTLYIGRLISGVFAASSIIVNAYLSDQYKGEELAVKFGYAGAMIATGMIFGPVVGGYLGLISVRAPFYFAAAMSFINLLLILWNLPETHRPTKKERVVWSSLNPFALLPTLIKKSPMRHLFISNFFLDLSYTAYNAIFAFSMIAKFAWKPVEIGFSLLLFGIGGWLGQAFFVKFSVRRFGINNSIIIGLITFTVGFLMIGFAAHPYWIYLTVPVSAVAGVYGAAFYAKMSDLVNKDEQGRIYGLLGSSQGLALMIGPLLMSAIYFYFMESDIAVLSLSVKAGTPFLFGAVLTTLAMIIILAFEHKLKGIPDAPKAEDV